MQAGAQQCEASPQPGRDIVVCSEHASRAFPRASARSQSKNRLRPGAILRAKPADGAVQAEVERGRAVAGTKGQCGGARQRKRALPDWWLCCASSYRKEKE